MTLCVSMISLLSMFDSTKLTRSSVCSVKVTRLLEFQLKKLSYNIASITDKEI